MPRFRAIVPDLRRLRNADYKRVLNQQLLGFIGESANAQAGPSHIEPVRDVPFDAGTPVHRSVSFVGRTPGCLGYKLRLRPGRWHRS